MKALEAYLQSVLVLCNLFVDAYYTYDDGSKSDYCIVGDLDIGVGPIEIDDSYRTIDNIACALHNKIPKKILFDWYYEIIDNAVGDEVNINLYNYRLKNAQLHEVND